MSAVFLNFKRADVDPAAHDAGVAFAALVVVRGVDVVAGINGRATFQQTNDLATSK